MAKLYELTDQYAALIAQLEDAESEEQESEILSQIDALSEDINEKAENYAKIRANFMATADELTAQANIFKAEADRLMKKATAKRNEVKRLYNYLSCAMELADLKQLPTSIGKFYTQRTVSVDVLDAWAVPAEYTTPQPPKVDKNAIRKVFTTTGEILDGVEIKVTNGVRFR